MAVHDFHVRQWYVEGNTRQRYLDRTGCCRHDPATSEVVLDPCRPIRARLARAIDPSFLPEALLTHYEGQRLRSLHSTKMVLVPVRRTEP